MSSHPSTTSRTAYDPQNKVYSVFSLAASASMVMATWERLLYSINYALAASGPAGAIWSFLLVWLGNLAVFASLSEMASIAPHESGQTYWIGLLLPRRWRKPVSYVFGWITLMGWVALTTSGGYMTDLAVVTTVQTVNVGYVMPRWLVLLTFVAIMGFSLVANVVINKKADFALLIFALFHVCVVFAVLVPMMYYATDFRLAPVFTTFVSSTGSRGDFMGFMLATLSAAYGFTGCETPVLLTEETKYPETTVPNAMLSAILMEGALGIFSLAMFLSCDMDFFTSQGLGEPAQTWDWLTHFINGSYNSFGLTISTSLSLMFACLYWYAISARFVWRMGKDKGIPFSKWFQQLEKQYTGSPIHAMVLVAIVCSVQALGMLWNPTIFRAIICLAVTATAIPTFGCNCLLLWRRLTGAITHSSLLPFEAREEYTKLTWGPWRIKEPWGTIINVFACCFHVLIIFASSLPDLTSVHDGFNYSPFIVIAWVIMAVVIYRLHGVNGYSGHQQPNNRQEYLLTRSSSLGRLD